MSDIKEDNIEPPPPPLYLEVYDQLTSVSTQLEAIARNIVPVELLDTLKRVKDRLNRIETKPRTVAVVGRTGVGKSTLNCALLKCVVLPSSSLVNLILLLRTC
jgi:putative ribosome biogenesis GTPase RsgA